MRQLKLIFYKWQLRRQYLHWTQMLDEVDCGITFLRQISPDFARTDKRVSELFTKCKTLEATK